MKFINKRLCNKLFNNKKTTDAELLSYQQFISGTIIGSSYEFKEWMDFVLFNNIFKPNWNKLYNRYILNNKKELAVFDNNNMNIITFINDNNIIENDIAEFILN